MCIIIVKEKGVKMPDEKTLKSCFVKNPDGAGFMYSDGKSVTINKGFMSFTNLKKALGQIENSIDKTIVIHMRIATSGNIDGKTCHPFPIAGAAKNIDVLSCKTPIGFAHNGILHEFEYDTKNYSDTQNYVKDFLSILYRAYGHSMLENDNVQHAIDITSEGCRFAFLEPSGTVYYFGKWYNENGIHYSNTGYQQTSTIKPYTAFNDKYDYESYYDYSWYDDYDTIDSIIDKAFEDDFLTFDEMLYLQEHGTEISDNIYELEGIFIKTSKGLKVSVYDY